MKRKLEANAKDDGEFYMSFSDFLMYFGKLEICHLGPSSMDVADTKKKFKRFRFYGNWRAGLTAGGCGNPEQGGFSKW